MEKMRSTINLSLSEVDAKAVLERAAKIDGDLARFSVDELNHAARAAGISDEAFAQAVLELAAERRATFHQESAPSRRTWLPPFIAATVGATAGAMMGNGMAGIILMGPAMIGLTMRLMQHREARTFERFVVEATCLFAAFPLACALAAPYAQAEAAAFSLAAWTVSCGVGAATILRRRRPLDQRSDAD